MPIFLPTPPVTTGRRRKRRRAALPTGIFDLLRMFTQSFGSGAGGVTAGAAAALPVKGEDLDTEAPATPTGLVPTTGTAADVDGTIKPFLNLEWNANTESDMASYQVDYRRQGDTPFSSQLVRKEIISVRYYGVVGDVVYEARIAAIDKTGNPSAFTSLATITTAKDTGAPAAPTSVTITAGFQLNVVQWVPPADVDWDVVEVWRSVSNDSSTAVKAGEHRGIMFFDGKLGNATTYYYWLRSRDTSKNLSAFHTTQFAGTPGTTLRVATDDVADAAIEAIKLKDGAVTTLKLADLAVTNIKVAVGVIEKTRMNWNTHLIY